MVIRLGRNGRFLACSLFPEHKESRPLPGEEPPPQAGEGEVCPQCGEGTLVGKRGKFGPFVGCSRYPDCTLHPQGGSAAAGPARLRGPVPEEPRRRARPASRAADRQRLLWVLELPEVRLHDELRARSGRSTTRTTARSRATARRGSASSAARTCRCRRGRTSSDGGSRAGRRTPRRWPGPPAAAVGGRHSGGGRPRRALDAVDIRPIRRLDTRRAPGRAQDRDRARRVRPTRRAVPRPFRGPRMTAASAGAALEAYLGSLAARDTSLHTQRSYAPHAPRLPRLAGGSRRRLAGAGPRRPARLPRRPRDGPRPELHRAAARGDPLVPPVRGPRRPRAGRPLGRDRDAAPAEAAATGPRGRRGRATARRGGRAAPTRRVAAASGPRSRCATSRSSRPPTRPACGSASWPRPSSGRSTCAGASCGSWARAARSGSGCSVGRRGRRSRHTCSAAAPSSRPARRTAAATTTALFLNHRGAAARGARAPLPPRAAPPAGGPAARRLAAHAAPFVRHAPPGGRRRSPRRPGAARAREPRDDAGLHPRLAGAPAGRLSRCPSARLAARGDGRDRRTARVTSSRALARAGLIVSGAFLVSRILGWLRVVVIVNGGLSGSELDTFFAAFRLPDLVFQLVAAGALSSAVIPVISGLLATDETARAWRVVSTIANLMLIALLVLARRRVRRGAGDHPGDHARVQPGPVGPDGRPDPDHDPEPDLPGPRVAGDERPQRSGAVRRLGDRADRLQPRDHRRGLAPRPDVRRHGARDRRRRRARSATCWSSSGRSGGSGSTTTGGSSWPIPRRARRSA